MKGGKGDTRPVDPGSILQDPVPEAPIDCVTTTPDMAGGWKRSSNRIRRSPASTAPTAPLADASLRIASTQWIREVIGHCDPDLIRHRCGRTIGVMYVMNSAGVWGPVTVTGGNCRRWHDHHGRQRLSPIRRSVITGDPGRRHLRPLTMTRADRHHRLWIKARSGRLCPRSPDPAITGDDLLHRRNR